MIILILISFVQVLALAGCGSGEEEGNNTLGKISKKMITGQDQSVTKDIFAMDTYMTLTAYGDNAEEALGAAEKEIKRIETLLSTGIESSEISKLNQEGEAYVSGDTTSLIKKSMDLYKDTEGVFDITIYPLMKAWGFTDSNYRIPKEDELSALLDTMGADQISIEEKTDPASGDTVSQVVLGKEGMEIDLGGIAKGYTSERVMEIFKDYGIEHAVISLGGNVQVLNDKPDGSAWRIAVEDPDDTSSYVGIIQVKDKAVITSGGYERYFEQDGQSYHHIIDPETGYPAKSGLKSVTIVSDDGTLADGLSTALFIMGKEKAVDYWRKHRDFFDMVLVEDNGAVSVTEGIAGSFSCDKEYEIVSYY